MRLSTRALTLLAVAAAPLAAQDDPKLLERARAIHAKVLKLDTHVDFAPSAMTGPPPNYVTGIPRNQVDLPKMLANGLDAVFFSIYTGQRQDFTDSGYARARAEDIAKFDAVHALAERIAPDKIAIAYTAADATRIFRSGKKVALMGVENGYPLGEDIANVRDFYQRGARYLSLAHNGHNQLSDSNTGEQDNVWKWNGLSPMGRRVVQEANVLGIMLDISHPSKVANMQVMGMSMAPVIASHSAIRNICNHSRNLDDDQLHAIADGGGVVQVVAFNAYIKTPPPASPERTAALAKLRQEFGLGGGGGGARGAGGAQASDSVMNEFRRRQAELDAKYPPPPRATVRDFVDHIDYAVKMIGIDHVGISSDFDGGGGIEGYSNASESINVTIELVRRGYSERDIEKLWGGNLLRVMAQVEKVAKQLQAQQRGQPKP
ncbi:MAG: membrane dipeptidase [Gemmatimonadetes bacterium]|nr:membrane dipeptidase [Gemmatimonadota bacterium]